MYIMFSKKGKDSSIRLFCDTAAKQIGENSVVECGVQISIRIQEGKNDHKNS
jgi:hypothetical protein